MRKLHILFIPSWYPDKKNPTHGIFNRLFVEAAARHCQVSVLFATSDENVAAGYELTSEQEPSILTVRVRYPGSARRRSLPDKIRQYRRRLVATKAGFRHISEKAGKPDLIHLNVVLPAGPAALQISRYHNIPLLVNEGWTGYDPQDGQYRGFITKYLTRKVISAAKMILPVTSYLARLMQQHGLKGNYRVVPNVIDTEIFQPRAATLKRPVFRFIHVSSLDDRQKNVSGILRAFALAVKQRTDMELLIVGDGEDGPGLKRLSASLENGDRVRFIGRVNPVQLAALFRESDALVMFSNYETFCVVVPEALACGVPVITSDTGGIMSYFVPSLGAVVPVGNEDALSKAMLEIVGRQSQFDVARLRAFVAERFSAEVVSSELLNLYAGVLRS